ncbi:hypothetical protein P3T35_006522 [Kitasatospora sp. GP30]|nr:hypothetical protein [Kitasatospora sp. GP30]
MSNASLGGDADSWRRPRPDSRLDGPLQSVPARSV